MIFLLSGLAVCWFAWTKILSRVVEVRSWQETPCRVIQWEVKAVPDNHDVYKVAPEIAYEYEAAGQVRTGTTYDAALAGTPTLNELEEQGVSARNQPSVCQVNPADPQQSSFTRPGYAMGSFVLGLGFLFVGIGGLIVLAGLFHLLGRAAHPGSAVSGLGKGCAGGVLAPVFFGIFAIAGFAVWKLAIHGQPDWAGIGPRMVEVPAKIIASGISRHTSSGKNSSTTYSARIAWEFGFEGRTWRSGWLDFDRSASSSSNYQKAADVANRYPAGSTARAWVDPQGPWRAVLEKKSGARWWLWIFPIIFGGIGLLGLVGWLLKVTALGAAWFGTRPDRPRV